MLNEHAVYRVQTMNNVTDLSRLDTIGIDEYVQQCRLFVVNNNTVDGITNANEDAVAKHKRLISLLCFVAASSSLFAIPSIVLLFTTNNLHCCTYSSIFIVSNLDKSVILFIDWILYTVCSLSIMNQPPH